MMIKEVDGKKVSYASVVHFNCTVKLTLLEKLKVILGAKIHTKHKLYVNNMKVTVEAVESYTKCY